MKKLPECTIEALQQLRELIVAVQNSGKPPAETYAGSGIGRHVRHVIDHFRALAAGIDCGCIDYNIRSRNSAIERDPHLSLLEIHRLIDWLATLRPDDEPVLVVSEISCHLTENQVFRSNTNRELLYLINHTIHHVAYAALLAKSCGIECSEDVGFAPATASFLRQCPLPADESLPYTAFR
jgi:arginine utilization protein RocB